MTAIVSILGGWRATLFFALLVVAVLAAVIFRGNAAVSARSADSANARAQASEAIARSLSKQAEVDRSNLADASARSQKAQEDKDNAKHEADRTIADLRTGELRLKARLAVATKANSAGDPSRPQGQESPGLRTEDAEFLVRLAADADQDRIERNEAVEGWGKCRAISEQGDK